MFETHPQNENHSQQEGRGGAPPPGTGNTAGEAAANKRPTDQVESDNHYQAGGNQ